MKLLPLFLLGLLGLFFIALLSFKFNKPIIENELTENTHEALLSEGMNWATPSANGQTITLKGIADNNELRLHTESIAQAVKGVARVNNQLTVSSLENTTDQAEPIMVNEGDDVVDSISAITTEASTTESAEPTSEVEIVVEEAVESIEPVTEVAEIVVVEEVESIEPVTEMAETEVAVVEAVESIEPVTEIAETEVAVVEEVESIEPVTEAAEIEVVVVEEAAESTEPVAEITETEIVVEESITTEAVAEETSEVITTSEPANEVLNTCQQQFDELLTNEKIRFETNSEILSEGNSQLLTKLVKVIESCPAFKIVIEGHTDADGEVIANQILSEQRAYRVYDELVKRGIRSAALLAIGYGESRPLNTDNTAESKAQNRRIELKVQEN